MKTRLATIQSQLDQYMAVQRSRFAQRAQDSDEVDRMIAWAAKFIEEFLLSRALRSADLKKPELEEARLLELAYMGRGNHHFVVDCMDGRNIPAIMLSHVPHVGGVMRTQAGELFGFAKSTAGSVVVDKDSYEVQSIVKLLLSKPGETIYYSLDSHVGCAARGKICKISGATKDMGLSADVRRKVLIASGIRNIRHTLLEAHERVADIFPQFFSYDPHDGTLMMGLEAHADTVGENGFTSEILDELSKEGKIVKTWDLLHDASVATELRKHVKQTNFRSLFAQSLLSNWQALTLLYAGGKGAIFTSIVDRLQKAYVLSGWKVGKADDISGKKISTHVLEHKAKVLLKNLITRWSIAQNHHHWPFDKHIEQAIIFTEGGYAPFPSIDVFSLFSREDNALIADHAYLAVELIRDFRVQGTLGNGGITDPVNLLSGREFIEAPIIIMNKAVLREVSAEAWETLENVDLSKLLTLVDWDDFSLRDWRVYDLERVLAPKLSHVAYEQAKYFVAGIYEVFDRMRYMMMRDYRFRDLLLTGKVMVVNMLVDRDRKVRAILPLPA